MSEVAFSRRRFDEGPTYAYQLFLLPKLLSYEVGPDCAHDLHYQVFLAYVNSRYYLAADLQFRIGEDGPEAFQQIYMFNLHKESQKALLCRFALQAFPIHATITMLPLPLLCIVNYISSGGHICFQPLAYCGGSFKPFGMSLQPYRVFSLGAFLKKNCEFKNKLRVIGYASIFLVHVLVLIGATSAQIVELEITCYKIGDNFVQDDDTVKYVSKRFGRYFGEYLRPFAEINSMKQLLTVSDQVSGQPCFMDYSPASKKLIIVSYYEGDKQLQITTFRQEDHELLSICYQFSITMPINPMRLLPFSDLMLKPGYFRASHIEMSRMNAVICFESIDVDKISVMCVHLHNGSLLKLSDQFDYGTMRTSRGEQFLVRSINHTYHAQMITDYLISCQYINSEQRDAYTDYYDRFFTISNLERAYPYIVPFSYGFVWITPNFRKNTQSMYIVASTPFRAMEKIFHSQTTFGYSRIAQLFSGQTTSAVSFYDSCNAADSYSEHIFYYFKYNEIYRLQQRTFSDMQELYTKIQPTNLSESTYPSSSHDFLQNSFYTDHLYDSTDSEMSNTNGDHYHLNVVDPGSSVLVLIFAALFGNANLGAYHQLYPCHRIRCKTDSDAETFDFFKIVQDEVLKLADIESGELSRIVVNRMLFSRAFIDRNNRHMLCVVCSPHELLRKIGAKASLFSFYIQYSQTLRYYQEIIMCLPMSYHVQFGEMLNILQLIFGEEVYLIMQQYYYSRNVYYLLYQLIVYLLSHFESSSPAYVEPGVLYNILSLAEALDYYLSQVDKQTNNVRAPSADRVFGKFYIDNKNNRRLCSILGRSRFLDVFHDRSKEPFSNASLFKRICELMLAEDRNLAELLNLKAIDGSAAATFAQFTYDPFFLVNSDVERPGVESANRLLELIAHGAAEINQTLYSYTNHQQVFTAFISDAAFSNYLMTVAALFEQLLARYTYSDIANGNYNFVAVAESIFPQWLSYYLYQTSSFDSDIYLQSGFFYTDYDRIPEDASPLIYYNRALTIAPLEFYLFANVSVATPADKKRSKLGNYFSPRPSEQAFVTRLQIEEKMRQGDVLEQLLLIQELEMVNVNYGGKEQEHFEMFQRVCGYLKLPYNSKFRRRYNHAAPYLTKSGYLKYKFFDYMHYHCHSEPRQTAGEMLWASQPWFAFVFKQPDEYMRQLVGNDAIADLLLTFLHDIEGGSTKAQ